MPKPDRVLRFRPLNEVQRAISRLSRVVLFNPDPICKELPPQYCVCGQGERRGGKKTKHMVQCVECWQWFHFDCVGLGDEADIDGVDWKCEWCSSAIDQNGRQRWISGRKKAKLRHFKDTPKHQGGVLGGDPPIRYSNPRSWDDKVLQVQELARRAAIKKRKLTEAVEVLVNEGGHHLVDAEGMAGLELRPVDDGMVDEMVGAGLVEEDSNEGNDERSC